MPDPRTILVLGGGIGGDGEAGFGGGDFYAEPKPSVALRLPSWRWHLAKVWFEKSWLYTQL